MDHRLLFQGLAEYLRANEYSLVVDQVQEELASGHLDDERIRTNAGGIGQSSGSDVSQRSKPGDFVRRTEYSSMEALVLLIEAAQRAIIDPALIVADVGSELAKDGIDSIVFELPEEPDLGAKSLTENQLDESFQGSAGRFSLTLPLDAGIQTNARESTLAIALIIREIEAGNAS